MNQPNTRRADLPETPWAFAALCADMPSEIFDVAAGRLQTAKAACAHCTVAHQCLRWAINNEIEDEIWGGRSPAERRRLGRAFVLDLPSPRPLSWRSSSRSSGRRRPAPSAHPSNE